MGSLEERFNKLVVIIQNLPKEGDLVVDNDAKLNFYSYYKQATIGDCNTDKPSFYKLVEKAKWNAWDSRKGMSKDEAMQAYLNEMGKILKASSNTDHQLYRDCAVLIN